MWSLVVSTEDGWEMRSALLTNTQLAFADATEMK